MMNNSGLLPVGRAVLIKPYIPERREGLIVIPDEALGRDMMVEQRAIVVALGPSAWCDEPRPRAAIGDKVLISRFAGYMAKGTKDGEQYRFINDKDIFAVIEHEESDDGH
jgi:co-chaperonin GroES (HSP10)